MMGRHGTWGRQTARVLPRASGGGAQATVANSIFGDRVMHGRDTELSVALDMVRAAEAGRGGIVLVEGEPGVGKSEFLTESAAAAAARGFTLAWRRLGQRARGDGPDWLLPPSLEDFLSPTAGDGTAAGRRGRPRQAAEPPGAPPAGGADQGPTLVVLDDLHRADPTMIWRLRGLAGPGSADRCG